MKRILAAAFTAAAMGLLTAAPAQATPLPGCALEPSLYGWYNPCSGQAPWNQPNWSGTDGIPWHVGAARLHPRDDATHARAVH